MQAFVVVGDSNGHVGLGVKCAKEVSTDSTRAGFSAASRLCSAIHVEEYAEPDLHFSRGNARAEEGFVGSRTLQVLMRAPAAVLGTVHPAAASCSIRPARKMCQPTNTAVGVQPQARKQGNMRQCRSLPQHPQQTAQACTFEHGVRSPTFP